MRTSLAVLTTLAACALIPAAAAADTITVMPEPAGANCPAGGVKITVTPTQPAPPAPPLPDQVSYVCSGPAGADGTPGTDGAPGVDGQDGTPGADGIDGADGSNGFDGSNGSDGSSGSSATSASRPSCGAASRIVGLRLPPRYRNGKTVTETVNGHRHGATVSRHTVDVDLRGLACGSYPVVVQRRGVKPVVRIFTLNRDGRIGRTSVVG